jgi:hypothetical protein
LTQALPGFVLLLHSAEAARHFIAETDRLKIARDRIHAIAIGPRVATAAAQGGWASLATALPPPMRRCWRWPKNLPERRRMMEEFPNQPYQPRNSAAWRWWRWPCAGRRCVGVAAWQSGWHPALPGFAHPAPPPAPVPMNAAQQPCWNSAWPSLTSASPVSPPMQQWRARRRGVPSAAHRPATRRTIERGQPLAYLEGQLRLRFGEALPNVVTTLIAFARKPVTVDRLSASLEMLAPQLAGPDEQTTWSKVKHDISGLFVLHSASNAGSPAPRVRLDHARLCLKEGRIEDAIADVRLLPGARAAQAWLADAQRYADAAHALDALDTAALLDPKLLRDGNGKLINQASPIRCAACCCHARAADGHADARTRHCDQALGFGLRRGGGFARGLLSENHHDQRSFKQDQQRHRQHQLRSHIRRRQHRGQNGDPHDHIAARAISCWRVTMPARLSSSSSTGSRKLMPKARMNCITSPR